MTSPLPVLLTRYAAQSLYAPLRTLEPVAGIRPVVPPLPRQITTLYPSEPPDGIPGGGMVRRRTNRGGPETHQYGEPAY